MNSVTVRRAILENGKTIFSFFRTGDRFNRIEYLAEGDDNYIYKVWGEQAVYALRVLKPSNVRVQQDYDFEFAFQDYLRQHDVPIPKLYACGDSQHYATFDLDDGQLQLTLHEFVAGEAVTDPSIAQVRAVGTLLGKFHRLAATCDIPYDRLEHIDMLSWLDDANAKPTADDELTSKAYALYQEHAQHIRENLSAFPKVPLHNDIHLGNLLFNGDRIVAVLDFDESHKHFIPLELGWSTGKICNFGGLDNFKANLEVFRQAYTDGRQGDALSKLGESVAMSALVAEVSRKLLKNPTDSHERRRFQNVLDLVNSGDTPPMRTRTLSSDKKRSSK